MEIRNNLNPLDPYNQARLDKADHASSKVTGRNAADNASAGETGDRVSLSPEAMLRTEAFSAAMNTPEVRAEKVAEIKALVDAGEYEINSQAIASRLLTEEPGLFRP